MTAPLLTRDLITADECVDVAIRRFNTALRELYLLSPLLPPDPRHLIHKEFEGAQWALVTLRRLYLEETPDA